MKQQQRWGMALVTMTVLATGPALAHHSFSAVFDANKPIRLVGTLKQIDWTNPHIYLHLDVPDKNGVLVEWAVEAGNPGLLSRRGFKKSDVHLGDKLIVDGYLAKTGAKLMDGQRVTLPDGRVLMGSSTGAGAAGGGE